MSRWLFRRWLPSWRRARRFGAAHLLCRLSFDVRCVLVRDALRLLGCRLLVLRDTFHCLALLAGGLVFHVRAGYR